MRFMSDSDHVANDVAKVATVTKVAATMKLTPSRRDGTSSREAAATGAPEPPQTIAVP
jgi:hypothetical protein